MKKYITKRFFAYALLLIALSGTFIYFDIHNNEQQINTIIQDESKSIINTISVSLRNSIIASARTEDEIISQLNNSAWIIAKNFSSEYTHQSLNYYAKNLGLKLVLITDDNNRIVATNSSLPNIVLPTHIQSEISGMVKHKYKWIEIGFVDSLAEYNNLYFLAHNDIEDGRIIILSLDATKLSEYRKEFGVGKQIQELVKNPDIHHITLTDSIGNTLATATQKNLDENDSEDDNYYITQDEIETQDNNNITITLGMNLSRYDDIVQSGNIRSIIIGSVFILSNLFVFIFLNIRKTMTEIKKESKSIQEYNDLILENTLDAIIGVDSEGKIIIANHSANNLISKNDEINNKLYKDIFAEDIFEISVPDSVAINRETHLQLADSKIFISYSKTNLQLNNGKLISIIIFRDISKEKLYQEEIQRKEKAFALANLAAGVAHEIRNPLNAINIIVQRFEYEFTPKEDADEYIQLVRITRSEIERLNRIIRQFLEFSRPAPLNLIPTNAFDFLESSFRLLEQSFNQNNISLNYNINLPKAINIMIDEDKIRQAIINIAKNAFEAINDNNSIQNGLITCSAEIFENHLLIKIKDNGGGISPNEQSKIFNLYYSNKKHGTGLGLSIVHQIISEHKGSIHLNSDENNGTEFIISLNLN